MKRVQHSRRDDTLGEALVTHTLYLIDDHPGLRRALAQFVDDEPNLTVCGEAGSAQEAFSELETLTPDLVLVDVAMPEINGIEFVRTLKEKSPHLKCLMVSAHAQQTYKDAALEAGAHGYVTKEDPLDVLEAIRTVLRGEVYQGQWVGVGGCSVLQLPP